jgi:polyisoprenoid-binding protein YceI
MSWNTDYSHSNVQFSVRHMMISTVRGQFDKFTVNADIDENDVTRSKLDVQIDAASINTRDAKRDAHLHSADFFHAKEYPVITFKSTRGEKTSDRHGKMYGDLTMRGITKEVALDVEFIGQAKSPWGTTSAGFTAYTKINRKDWDLTWNVGLETGGVLVSDEVKIDIDIEFTKVPETVPAPAPVQAVVA